MNIHLYTTDVLQPPHQEDLRVVVEYIPGLNNSMAGVNILTSRPIFSHLLYQYLPAGIKMNINVTFIIDYITSNYADNWINLLIFSFSLCIELVEPDDSIIFEFLSPGCSDSYLSLTFNYIEVLTFSTFKVLLYFVFCNTSIKQICEGSASILQ